jgi:predicted AAA+ superfamily ATPase
MFGRWVEPLWKRKLAAPYVHLVFGARQTGKSTLLRKLLPEAAVWLDLSRPAERTEYLRNPDLLVQRCRALPKSRRPATVVVDEAQNAPAIFDAVQHLYDSDKRRWRFVLCGSSARKLRVTGANLLPGRSFLHHLYPLLLVERPPAGTGKMRAETPLPMPARGTVDERWFPATDLIERLTFGELPAVAIASHAHRADLLSAYTLVYLEEELRREALVKNWPAFARFLQLAATESGQMINYAAISREAGVSLPTVKTYYQLLEDMFLGFRVTGFSGSPRKSLLSTERFCCRIAAGHYRSPGESRPRVRAMGGHRVVETPAIPGRRQTALPAHQGGCGGGFHHCPRRPAHPDRSEMDRAPQARRRATSADVS